MAILPDDIREIDQSDPAIKTILNYIKYMKEQIEFWGSRREIDIRDLQTRVKALEDEGE